MSDYQTDDQLELIEAAHKGVLMLTYEQVGWLIAEVHRYRDEQNPNRAAIYWREIQRLRAQPLGITCQIVVGRINTAVTRSLDDAEEFVRRYLSMAYRGVDLDTYDEYRNEYAMGGFVLDRWYTAPECDPINVRIDAPAPWKPGNPWPVAR